jgi:hypothetical protein
MPKDINGIPLNWSEEDDQKIFGKLFPNGLGKPIFGGTLDDIAPTITIDENYISPLWGSHVEKKELALANENATYQARELGNKTEKEKWYIDVKEHKNKAEFEKQKASKQELQEATLQLHIIEHNNKKIYEFSLGAEVQPVVDALSMQDFAMYAQEIVDLLPTYNLPLEAIKQAKILAISTNRQAKQDAVKLQQQTNKPTANPNATEETVNLFNFLIKLQNDGKTLFGQQDPIITGRSKGFTKTTNAESIYDYNSDFKAVTNGDMPAVFAWDIGRLENYAKLVTFKPLPTEEVARQKTIQENANELINKIGDKKLILKVTISQLIKYIKQVHKAGGINTICWHMNSPLSISETNTEDKFFKNEKKQGTAINAIFSNKKEDEDTKNNFDKILEIATYFFHCLKEDDSISTNATTKETTTTIGKLIPVIFRPFHEPKTDLNDCFWWSNIEKDDKGLNEKKGDLKDPKKPLKSLNEIAAENYKQLWQKLQNKFDGNGVNNVLYSFCLQDEFIDAHYTQHEEPNDFISFSPYKGLKPFIKDLIPDKYDIIGFDAYQRLGKDKYDEAKSNHNIAINYYKKNDWLDKNESHKKFTHKEFTDRLQFQYNALKELTKGITKLYAIQEIGADFLNFNEDWFGKVLLPFINKYKLAYFTTWRNANRGEIKDNKVNIKAERGKWKIINFPYVDEYYLPFLPDYKYPASIEEEIKTTEKYMENIGINSKKDYYVDYLDTTIYQAAKDGLANKKQNEAEPKTQPPAENPYVKNFKTFVNAANIITLSKLKSMPK